MKTPHLYLSQGFVIQGTPISKEELERETGTKTAFGKDAVFLGDVTLLGTAGTVAEVQYLVLSGTAISGIGKNNIRISTPVGETTAFNSGVTLH
jgi:hypothetical protein